MKNARIGIAAMVGALAVGTGFAAAFTNPFGGPAKVAAVNGVVSVPLAKVSDGSAHKFRFESGGKTIVFFLVKVSDGNMHAAFDACDVCFREHKGYEQQGTAMACRNCGKKFAVNIVNAPEILLADEPTGNLDSRTAEEVMALFRELNTQGQTVVMVTHNPEFGTYSDRTIRLRDGRVC